MTRERRRSYDETLDDVVKEEVTKDTKQNKKSIEETKSDRKEETKRKSPSKVETTVPETVNGVVVNTLNVNVRRWPDKDSEIVETLHRGDQVVIYGKKGDFYEVSTSANHRVYISSEYLEEE